MDDPRAYLLASLSWPPTMYVNCDTSKNFECVHHSCNGKYSMNTYSLGTIIELLGELAEQGKYCNVMNIFMKCIKFLVYGWFKSFNFVMNTFRENHLLY